MKDVLRIAFCFLLVLCAVSLFASDPNDKTTRPDELTTPKGELRSKFIKRSEVGIPEVVPTIITSWPGNAANFGWGVGFQESQPSVWNSECNSLQNVEYSTVGVPTGSVLPANWGGGWAADMEYDANRNLMYQVNVAGDNCIHTFNPDTGAAGPTICDPVGIWTATSQRGVAYDDTTDTLYVGGWNDARIFHIAGISYPSPGTIIQSFSLGWAISGLAMQCDGTLVVVINGTTDTFFVVDPTNMSILSTWNIPGGGGYCGAGVDADPAGPVWIYNQINQMMYEVDINTACGARLGVQSTSFIDNCSVGGVGDHNNVLDPGETVDIFVTLNNYYSLEGATNVSAILSTTSPDVQIVNNSSTYPDIPPSGTGTSITPYVINLSPGLVCGTVLNFTLNISSAQGSWSGSFSLVVGSVAPAVSTTVLEEHFEVWPLTGWTITAGGCGIGWESGLNNCNYGNNTGGTGDYADANSDCECNPMDTSMVSAPFDLSGAFVSAQLQFKSDFQDYGSSDEGFVDITTNGGSTWANLLYYNRQHYPGPRTETINLTPYLGNTNCQLRFRYVAPNWDWHWQVDDVVVTKSTSSSCTFTPCITCSPISLSPAVLPNGMVNRVYDRAITASGGIPPYIYSISGGNLPPGISLNAASGNLYGTPTTAGSYEFTITATDANFCTGSQDYILPIWVATCETITLIPSQLPVATIGVSYSETISAVGGIEPYTFNITSGSLPAGITLNSTSGILSGTPTVAETNEFTITATDASGCSGSRVYQLTITEPCQTITISPNSLPDATRGQSYSQNLTASGGTAPYTFSISSGAIPQGISLSTTGILTGTPLSDGTYQFTVSALDSKGCSGSRVYQLTITEPCQTITISPNSLPDATRGQSYSQNLTASGGTAPYTFSISSGAIPQGISLSTTGILTGTPLSDGTYQFTVSALDSKGCSGSKTYSLKVNVAVAGPVIQFMKKKADPFRIKVVGSNLQPGIQVFINGTKWQNVKWKSLYKIKIKGDGALKNAVPKNTPTQFKFVNSDGGETTVTWQWP